MIKAIKEKFKCKNKKKLTKVLSLLLAVGIVVGTLANNLTYANAAITNGEAAKDKTEFDDTYKEFVYDKIFKIQNKIYNLYSVNSVKYSSAPALKNIFPTKNGEVTSLGAGSNLIVADSEGNIDIAKAQTGVGTLMSDMNGNIYGFTYAGASTAKIYGFNRETGERELYKSNSLKASIIFLNEATNIFTAISTTKDVYTFSTDTGVSSKIGTLNTDIEGLTLGTVKYAISDGDGGFIIGGTAKVVVDEKTVNKPCIIKYDSSFNSVWGKTYDLNVTATSFDSLAISNGNIVAKCVTNNQFIIVNSSTGEIIKTVDLSEEKEKFTDITSNGNDVALVYSKSVVIYDGNSYEIKDKIEFVDSALAVSSATFSGDKLFIGLTNSGNKFRNDYIGSKKYSVLCSFVTDQSASTALKISTSKETRKDIDTYDKPSLTHKMVVVDDDTLCLTREHGINNSDIALFNRNEYRSIGSETTKVGSTSGTFFYVEMGEAGKIVRYYYDQYDAYLGKNTIGDIQEDLVPEAPETPVVPEEPKEDREIIAAETNSKVTMNIIKGNSGEMIVSIIKDNVISDIETYSDLEFVSISSTEESFKLTLKDENDIERVIEYSNEGDKLSDYAVGYREEYGSIKLNDGMINVYFKDNNVIISQVKGAAITDKVILQNTNYIDMEPTVDGGFRITIRKEDKKYIQKYTRNCILLDEEVAS